MELFKCTNTRRRGWLIVVGERDGSNVLIQGGNGSHR